MGNYVPDPLDPFTGPQITAPMKVDGTYRPRSQGLPARWGGHVGLEAVNERAPGLPAWVWVVLAVGATLWLTGWFAERRKRS